MLPRPGWRTRTRYYETLLAELAASGEPPDPRLGVVGALDRDALVAAAGQRRPSTLYYLVSPKGTGSLAAALASDRRQLFVKRRGESVVDHLVRETKVWSYWPHREGWLAALGDLAVTDRRFAASALVRVVADWAAGAPLIAEVGRFAPPVAAVEDLLTLAEDRHRAADATDLLTEVVRQALSPVGMSPAGVLGAMHDALASFVPDRPSQHHELTAELSDLMTELEYLLPRLPDDDRARLADELSPQLRGILALMGRSA